MEDRYLSRQELAKPLFLGVSLAVQGAENATRSTGKGRRKADSYLWFSTEALTSLVGGASVV